MANKEKRMKASDLFDQTDYFVGKTSEFAKEFPNIKKVEVTVVEKGSGVSEFTRERSFIETNLPGRFIDCHNPRCYGGGVDIGQFLHYMEDNRETEREENVRCRGYEGSPKGRINRGPCFNRFIIKINIAYKPLSK